MIELTTEDILTDFNGTVCRCGESKKPQFSFCWKCYRLLPATQKQALYKRFYDGYQDAFKVALGTLRDAGRSKRERSL